MPCGELFAEVALRRRVAAHGSRFIVDSREYELPQRLAAVR
jgi:hypothetical protein